MRPHVAPPQRFKLCRPPDSLLTRRPEAPRAAVVGGPLRWPAPLLLVWAAQPTRSGAAKLCLGLTRLAGQAPTDVDRGALPALARAWLHRRGGTPA